jgi:hypothetical protein
MQDAGKRGVTVKALKRVLKTNGLKTTGKKATLTRRAKKARLIRGGDPTNVPSNATNVPSNATNAPQSNPNDPNVNVPPKSKKDGGRRR